MPGVAEVRSDLWRQAAIGQTSKSTIAFHPIVHLYGCGLWDGMGLGTCMGADEWDHGTTDTVCSLPCYRY